MSGTAPAFLELSKIECKHKIRSAFTVRIGKIKCKLEENISLRTCKFN
jgi:hypothetical protein